MNTSLLWFIIAVLFSSIPLFLIKKYIETKNVWYIVTATLIYVSLVFLYYKLLVDYNMSKVYPLIKVVSIIIVVCFGVFLFDEKVSIYNIIGIILGLGSIYLLSMK